MRLAGLHVVPSIVAWHLGYFTFETMLAMAVARAMAVNSSIRTVVAHHSVLTGRYWVSFGSNPVYVLVHPVLRACGAHGE